MKNNMKNTYAAPSIEILDIKAEDVISTSGFDGLGQDIGKDDLNPDVFGTGV